MVDTTSVRPTEFSEMLQRSTHKTVRQSHRRQRGSEKTSQALGVCLLAEWGSFIIQQIFSEHLLCAGHRAWFWDTSMIKEE